MSAPAPPAPAEAPPRDPTLFTESLVIDLALCGPLGNVAVPGGNVKRLSLALEPYGFRGQVVFWMPAEEGADVHGRVTDPLLLELELTIAKRHYIEETPPAPLALKGVAIARSYVEVSSRNVVGSPVLFRQYTLEIQDAACALWSQHHPTDVYARTSLETVILSHAPTPIPVRSAWPALKAKRAILCLALGEDEASFYDLVCWFTDDLQGHFSYDYDGKVFRFSDKKSASLTATTLDVAMCAEARVHVAEAPRFSVNLLNSHAQGTARTPIANDLGVAAVERDVLMHTPLAQEGKDREAVEKRRIKAAKPELEIRCKAFPEVYLAPGVAAQLDVDEWSPQLYHARRTLRTLSVRLEATATDQSPEHDLGMPFTDHQVRLTYRFECDGDPRPRLPPFRRPRYPVQAEGTIQSTLGDDGDRAYTVYEDEQTSRDHYKVLLPVWNATLDVPFQPGFQPGHLYFPAYKNARVMLALGFDWARIEGFLDWGPSVRVPSTSQGNHILFGKNASSETSMRNWYVDAKPEFQIRRVHNGDTGVVTVGDGVISIETFADLAASALGGLTVSLAAEAEGSKAKAQGQTELAAADLDAAVSSAGGQLSGEVQAAAGAVKEQATALESDVRGRGEAAETALATVGADAQEAAGRAEQLVGDARQKIKGMFEGE
jgi:hypothetical protein